MERTAPPNETAELPDLSPGVQLLETDVRGALPALVVDHVLGGDRAASPGVGRALWADANGHARTRALADVAPDRRVLRRVSVARGFTAYQHYAIVEALAERALAANGDGTSAEGVGGAAAERAGERARDDDPADVALLVAPAIDAPYRDDGLRGDEGRELLVRALARLAGVARRLEVPVLVTRTADDDLAAPVANAAGETIACERTPMGPRFATDEFETLVYPAGDGLVQTTLAFWQRVLERRAPSEHRSGEGRAPSARSAPDWTDEPGVAAVGDGGGAGGEASAGAASPATGDRPAPLGTVATESR